MQDIFDDVDCRLARLIDHGDVGDIVVEVRFEAPEPGTAAGTSHAEGSGVAPRGTVDEGTAAFAIAPPAIVATLREVRPDGQQRQILLDGRVVTLGRATDNVIVLADRQASRHHARLHVRRDALVLTDLDSRNGTRVNGIAVSEVVLGTGDRIQIGETTLLVEAARSDDAVANG